MPDRVRMLKRFGHWHWWCPCCMGGDWYSEITDAWAQAQRHIAARHC